MESLEIEHEFECDSQLQCRSCLSVGRKLAPLAQYTNIYTQIAGLMHPHLFTQSIQICWECQSLLKKVSLFQQKVKKAHALLVNNQNFLYGSLSNLASITLNDTRHTVYLNEYDGQEIPNFVTNCNIIFKTNLVDKETLKPRVVIENNKNCTGSQKLQNSSEMKDLVHIKLNRCVSHNDNQKNILKRELDMRKEYGTNIPPLETLSIYIPSDNNNINNIIIKNKDNVNKEDKTRLDISNENSEEDVYFENGVNLETPKLNDTFDVTVLNDTCDIRTVSKSKKPKSRWATKRAAQNKKPKYKIVSNNFDKVPVFQCIKCGLKFCNRREFFKHHSDWHEKFICDHCGVSFKMRYCIKDHIRKQHSPFTCVPCNKTFARYNGLWLHNKLAHSPPTPPAYCVECDTRYKDIYRYKWHLCNSVKHSPKKKVSIPCPACEKTFTKRIYMKDHYNLVHLKLFRYRCQQCDKNFIRNAELVKHRRLKHEGILPPRNKMCCLCGRGFTTSKILRNHVRTHETKKHVADEDKLKQK